MSNQQKAWIIGTLREVATEGLADDFRPVTLFERAAIERFAKWILDESENH